MSRNPNVIFFPAADLPDREIWRATEQLDTLTSDVKRNLRYSNSLLRFGKQALEIYTKDPRFFATRTTEEVQATLLGFQTYQYFSAIVNRSNGAMPPRGLIKQTVDEMDQVRGVQRLSRSLRKLRVSYHEGLPKTSTYLERLANLNEAARFSFSEGAGIAYRLELGARTLAILEAQPPDGRNT